MPEIDLDGLSLKELKQLQKQVAKAISTFEDRKKKEALAALEAKAAEMGFSLSDLTTGKGGKISAPKYQNPDDPTQTWTGRGRKPGWFAQALERGTSPEEMLIS
ncbi:MAG: H-NS histone family protein [Marinovum algicola]|jgi:DNA-binding protein H-NS|uniref:DNA-binding protein H-NS n=1 Tax=Marinovum algicola TaxID=42444 RepID=A0A975W9C3_9RHOB|nr:MULTISPECIES: H-NS histone family protein [Marinovum]AKO98076.1 DNA-binding protein H-NS [Marinovum algicola DG 898]MDD9741989.1 H-NS histone family protein [Marinovum sp. SP66]MDD9746711.1 H-NS histone family protein [Marinovum sp. PR37]SEJ33646.1 DNA-binding protein H-NS [Marinovum algicola]SLN38180.1 H-NS histone family protein [Marinovum algicola]